MENYNSSRGLIQQMLRTRMAFRQALQRVLKRNNIDITFEMLQVLSSLCLLYTSDAADEL